MTLEDSVFQTLIQKENMDFNFKINTTVFKDVHVQIQWYIQFKKICFSISIFSHINYDYFDNICFITLPFTTLFSQSFETYCETEKELKEFISSNLNNLIQIKEALLNEKYFYVRKTNKIVFHHLMPSEAINYYNLLPQIINIFKELRKEEDCSICYDTGISTKCGHYICMPCLSKLHDNTCPMCRRIIKIHLTPENYICNPNQDMKMEVEVDDDRADEDRL